MGIHLVEKHVFILIVKIKLCFFFCFFSNVAAEEDSLLKDKQNFVYLFQSVDSMLC